MQAPAVDDTPMRPAWPESSEFKTYFVEAMTLLKNGGMAVQVGPSHECSVFARHIQRRWWWMQPVDGNLVVCTC